METIYKYALELEDEQIITLKRGAEILSAQEQNDQLVLWALVDPDRQDEKVKFYIAGTGNPLPFPGPYTRYLYEYIDTVQQGRFVWHIFQDTRSQD